MTLVEILYVAAVHLVAVPVNAYPIRYHILFPWRQTAAGRALMTKAVALALLFDVAIIGYWHPFPGYLWLMVGIVAFIGVAVSRQWALLECKARGR